MYLPSSILEPADRHVVVVDSDAGVDAAAIVNKRQEALVASDRLRLG